MASRYAEINSFPCAYMTHKQSHDALRAAQHSSTHWSNVQSLHYQIYCIMPVCSLAVRSPSYIDSAQSKISCLHPMQQTLHMADLPLEAALLAQSVCAACCSARCESCGPSNQGCAACCTGHCLRKSQHPWRRSTCLGPERLPLRVWAFLVLWHVRHRACSQPLGAGVEGHW